MKNKIQFIALAVLFITLNFEFSYLFTTIQAQTIGSDPFANVVKWKTSIDKLGHLKQGDVVTLRFEGTIDKGFHVFSSVPPAKDANLPTVIELDRSFIGFKTQGTLTEQGKVIKVYDDVFETDLKYFKDKVVFEQKYIVYAEKCLLIGNLKYQICDENSKCVAQSCPFEFKIIAP